MYILLLRRARVYIISSEGPGEISFDHGTAVCPSYCVIIIFRYAMRALSSGGLLGRTRRLPCVRTKIININNNKRNQILKYV